MTVHISLMTLIYIIIFFIILYLIYSSLIDTFFSNKGIVSYNVLMNNFIQKISKGNYFMNYGYWSKSDMNLLDANKELVNLILEKSGLLEEKNVKILDVGCGYGEQDFEWAKKLDSTNQITAIDISTLQIKLASDKCKRAKLDSRLFFEECDALLIDKKFVENEFNTVISVESAFHYSDRPKFFKNVYNILDNKGTFIISDIILNKNYKPGLINSSFLRTFSDILHIPKSNHIQLNEWNKSILDSGLKIIETIDITDKTFNPYYKNFFKEYIKNYNLPDFFASILYNYFSYVQPFSYVIVVCKKNIIEL